MVELNLFRLRLILDADLDFVLAWLDNFSVFGVVHDRCLFNQALLNLLLVTHWSHQTILLPDVLWVSLILSRFLDRGAALLRKSLRLLGANILDLDDAFSIVVVLVALALVAVGLRLRGLPKKTHDAVAQALEVLQKVEFQLLILHE